MQMEPELFAASDLNGLRDDLRAAGLDSWQAAELIGAFLVQRGYGVSNQDARSAAAAHRIGRLQPRLDAAGATATRPDDVARTRAPVPASIC